MALGPEAVRCLSSAGGEREEVCASSTCVHTCARVRGCTVSEHGGGLLRVVGS